MNVLRRRLRAPAGRARIEPPLQHVALDDERTGDLPLPAALGLRPGYESEAMKKYLKGEFAKKG